MKKIVVIDNYDSFTYNLVHAINNLSGAEVDVYRNDRVVLKNLEMYEKFVLSPGPGVPDEAGLLKPIIKRFAGSRSILGVCLGHQAIAEVFGGKLSNINQVFHGVATTIRILRTEDYIFKNMPDLFTAGRYHSWIVAHDELPDCFDVTAVAVNGEIMGISHKQFDVKGVQFHPESILTEYGEEIIYNWINH